MPKRSPWTTAASQKESGDRHNNNNNCICSKNSPSTADADADPAVVVVIHRLRGGILPESLPHHRSLDEMTLGSPSPSHTAGSFLVPPPPPTTGSTTTTTTTITTTVKQPPQQLPSTSSSSSSSWDEHDLQSQPPPPTTLPPPPPKKRVNHHYDADDWEVPTTPVPHATSTTTLPNKLPATPASIQKRNQQPRIQPRNHHPPPHGSTLPSPTAECHRMMKPPPVWLDHDDNNNNNNNDDHHCHPPKNTTPQQQQHGPPPTTTQRRRRKSKRSFGTCSTTTASSSTFTTTMMDVSTTTTTTTNHHRNNNQTMTHDDDDDDDFQDDEEYEHHHHQQQQQRLPEDRTVHDDDHHSVDTSSMTATKHFSFTSFPASLPRIHPARKHDDDDHRRRDPEHPHHSISQYHHHHHNNNNNNNNDSHNTSLSSWNHPPDPHDGFPSDDDEEEDDDVGRYDITTPTTMVVPRARLNFNVVASSSSSPVSSNDVDMMVVMEDTSSSSRMMMMYPPLAPHPEPDFVLSSSSSLTLRMRRPPTKIVAPIIPPTASKTTTTTLSTRGLLLTGSTSTTDDTHHHHCISPRMNYDEHVTRNDSIQNCCDRTNPTNRSNTNAGIIVPEFQFQLDAAQCSPIPGIPEEGDDVETTCSLGRRQTPNSRRLRRVTNATTGGSEGSISSHGSSSHGRKTSVRVRTQQPPPPPTTASSITSSQESSTITTTSQMTARPMPDRNAFEDLDVTRQYHRPYRHSNSCCDQYNANPNDTSRLSTSSISSSNSTTLHVNHDVAAVDLPPPVTSSPKWICPPTPVRIHPIFRAGHGMNEENEDDDVDNERERHVPYDISTSIYPPPHHLPQHTRQKLERSNSLIATKLIATCSPQLLLQNTNGDNATKTTTNDNEVSDHDTTTNVISKRSAASNVKAMNAATGRRHHNLDSDHLSLRASYPSRKASTSVASAVVDAAVGTGTTGEHLSNQPQEQQRTAISLTNNFDVVSTLGSGTFADVYKVISKTDHRAYAIKRNRRQFRSKRDREVLLSEVRCMQRLQSQMTPAPNLQQKNDDPSSATNASDYSIYLLFFYQAWQEDGHIFCQTELCCRDTCREMIDTIQHWHPSTSSNKFPTIAASWMLPPKTNDRASSYPCPTTADGYNSHNRTTSSGDGRVVPEHVIWKICHDICAGLSFIHSSKVGLVHNDVKPSNILFVKHQQHGAICKIGDFGMARDVGSSEDGQEGDQKYMALEMLECGTSYPSADIFSLGLTLYEMASHIHITIPPDGHRWHELRSGMLNMNDFPSDRSSELIKLIRRMMDPRPIYRPSTDDILSLSIVNDAGHAQNTFLQDYISDVEFCEVQEAAWMTQGVNKSSNNNMNCLPPSDEQTPRNASIRPLYSPPINAKMPPLPFAILPTPTTTTAAAAQR